MSAAASRTPATRRHAPPRLLASRPSQPRSPSRSNRYNRDEIMKQRSDGLASLLKEVCATVPSDRQTVDSLLQRAYQLEIKEKHIDAVGRESGSGAF